MRYSELQKWKISSTGRLQFEQSIEIGGIRPQVYPPVIFQTKEPSPFIEVADEKLTEMGTFVFF